MRLIDSRSSIRYSIFILPRGRRGSALLVSVGILAGLAIMAFTFAMMTHLEQIASAQYPLGYGTLQQISKSCIEQAAARLRSAVESYGAGAAYSAVDSSVESWWSDPTSSTAAGTVIWTLLGADDIAVSEVTVLDCASMININVNYADNSRLAAILDTLFDEIDVEIGDGAINGSGIDALSGTAVINYRTARGGSFASKEDLKNITDGDNDGSPDTLFKDYYEKIKNFVTIHSWIDPTTVRYVGGTWTAEPRAPVNINTASKPVLVAVLHGISNGTTTIQGVGGPTDLSQARALAERIMKKRDPEKASPPTETAPAINSWDPANPNSFYGPFDSWREFGNFLYAISDTTAGGTKLFNAPFEYSNDLMDSGATPAISPVFTIAHAKLLMANFNPNAHPSATNQNVCLYFAPPKRFTAADTTGSILGTEGKETLTNYTTEFCFSSMGMYEITATTRLFTRVADWLASSSTTTRLFARHAANVPPWSTGQYNGYRVLIYDGKGKGQMRTIYATSGTTAADSSYIDVTPAWTTQPDSSSRFYILGPAPDALDVACADANNDAIAAAAGYMESRDLGILPDQWNDFDLLAAKPGADYQVRRIASTQAISGGSYAGQRLNVATAFSPAPDSSYTISILGHNGLMRTSAVVKLYDVIRHSRQNDFVGVPGNLATTDADGTFTTTKLRRGPEPSDFTTTPVVNPSILGGLVCLADLATSVLPFRVNYNDKISNDDGTNANTGTASLNSIESAGDLRMDGVHVAGGEFLEYTSLQFNKRDTLPQPGTSTWTVMCEGAGRIYVKLGASHNSSAATQYFPLLSIRSANTAPGELEVIELAAQKAAASNNVIVQLRLRDDKVQLNGVVPTGLTTTAEQTADLSVQSAATAWLPGTWHDVAFTFKSEINCMLDDDANPANSSCDDTGGPDGVIDPDVQTRYSFRLWVDNVEATASGVTGGPGRKVDQIDTVAANKFNQYFFLLGALDPGDGAKIRLGRGPACVVAPPFWCEPTANWANTDATFDQGEIGTTYTDFTAAQPDRYAKPGAGGYTFVSPNLPIVGTGAVLVPAGTRLGTVSWTEWMPTTYASLDASDATNDPDSSNIQVTIELNETSPVVTKTSGVYGGTVAGTTPPTGIHATGNQGEGNAILDATTGNPIVAASPATIRYKVKFFDPGTTPCLETPILDDITITYIQPGITYLFWRTE